jgi:hypothetical protein
MSTQRYHKANDALEHVGVSGNEHMFMYLERSSQTSTASKKRKSVVLHEPRSVSTSAFVPTQPTSVRENVLLFMFFPFLMANWL